MQRYGLRNLVLTLGSSVISFALVFIQCKTEITVKLTNYIHVFQQHINITAQCPIVHIIYHIPYVHFRFQWNGQFQWCSAEHQKLRSIPQSQRSSLFRRRMVEPNAIGRHLSCSAHTMMCLKNRSDRWGNISRQTNVFLRVEHLLDLSGVEGAEVETFYWFQEHV